MRPDTGESQSYICAFGCGEVPMNHMHALRHPAPRRERVDHIARQWGIWMRAARLGYSSSFEYEEDVREGRIQ